MTKERSVDRRRSIGGFVSWRLAISAIGSGKGWFVFQSLIVGTILAGGLIGAAASPALQREDKRLAKRERPVAGPSTGDTPVLWWSRPTTQSLPGGRSMKMVAVAAEGRGAVVPLGLERNLEPGQAAVSPALAALIDNGEIDAGWLGGEPAAVIGQAGLHDPDELVLYQAYGRDQLAEAGVASPIVGSFRAEAALGSGGAPTAPVDMVAAAVAALAALPLLALLRSATLAEAERRRRRMAALDAVGMTSGELRRVALCEATCLSIVGSFAGLVAFNALVELPQVIRVGSVAVFASDLAVSGRRQGTAVAVIIAVCSLTAAQGLARAHEAERDAVRPSRTRALLLLTAAVTALLLSVFAGSLPEEGLVSRLALLAGATALAAVVIAAQRDLMLRLGQPREDDSYRRVLWRSDLRATAMSRSRPFAAVVLAAFVGGLAAVAYPSAGAEPAPAGSGRALSVPDALLSLPSKPTAGEVMDAIADEPAVGAILPITLGSGFTRTIHGAAEDVAAAYDLACKEPCSALSQADLARMFTITGHADDSASVRQATVIEVALRLESTAPSTIGRLAARVRDHFPASTVLPRTIPQVSNDAGGFNEQNLRSLGAVATAMALVGIVSALLFSQGHLRARRVVLKHLTVVGITTRTNAGLAVAHVIAASMVAVAGGVVAGVGCGIAYTVGASLSPRADLAPLRPLGTALLLGTLAVAVLAALRLPAVLRRTSLRVE